MNVVFISPHFPTYFYNFCDRLKKRGVHVLGIGDEVYDHLSAQTKASLTEYYRVDHLDDYEAVYRACGYFISKYGRLDWIESENEYWLELEATLRSDFNVNTGTKIEHMGEMKYKSKMKDVYRRAGIPVARYQLLYCHEDAYDFTDRVGYPIVVKPDNGVGASKTYKLENREELDYFLATKDDTLYIMEEFVNGHVETFDGITDSNKNILICSSHVMLHSIMDTVNFETDMAFFSQSVEDNDIRIIGEKVVKAFDTRSRFFHFEFFRLDSDKEGLGKKGDLIGLEVNMRAPGAYMPDMINYAYDEDVYSIWADMLVFDRCFSVPQRKYYVGYASRRHGIDYAYTHDEIIAMMKDQLLLETEIAPSLAAAMGNHAYLFRTVDRYHLEEWVRTILRRKDGTEWF